MAGGSNDALLVLAGDRLVASMNDNHAKFRGLTGLLSSVAANVTKIDSSSHLDGLLLRLYYNPHFDPRLD